MVPFLSLTPSLIALFFAAFAATTLLVWWMMPLFARIVDTPNARSLHTTPTPRGAGVAVMLVTLVLLGVAGLHLAEIPRSFLPLLVGAFGLSVVGLADDMGDLSPAVRLLAQATAVALAAGFLPVDAYLFQGFLPFWLDRSLLIFGWVWFMNLYNFMDGMDGLTALQTLHIGISLCVVAFFAVLPVWLPVSGLILAGAAAGFLVWNWHKARVFLGDVGSVPLGFIVAYCLIWLAFSGQPFAAFMLPLYYLVDGGFTLAHRLYHGHKPWQAHRSHGYQRAVQGGWSPPRVCVYILVYNFVDMLLATSTAVFANLIAYAAFAVAVLGAVFLVWMFYRKFTAAHHAL